LEFYNSLPFWTTFFTSLGFDVKLSHPSTRKLYERGLAAISSDTICFPAKLVHGHILDLADQQVNRIFMPSITVLPSENSVETSESVCAVVKGYPIVLRNTDNPERNWSIPFDNPLFYWYSHAERHRQLCTYMLETFGVAAGDTEQAIRLGDAAYEDFQYQLQEQGAQVLEHVELEGSLAVVLAARPYQSDPLVNHDLPQFFTKMSIPVLTADSLPGIFSEDLTNTRIDVVNNYHARMLAAARFVAHHPHLEYVQIVSFGCGHDALLSDEIARILAPAGKVPLVLKLDESDIAGPLNIRIQSFVESVRRRVVRGSTTKCLADPHPVKYLKEHQQAKTILVPNVSRAFCKVMSAAMGKQGVKVECLPLGGAQAIALGKKYVHNDICFPAQIVVGEALAALASGEYELDKVAIGTGKLIGDCRLTHYAALLRKALDEAGYAQVPIITNDDVDQKNIHPGYRMGIGTQTRFVMAITMVDALEQLLHKIRPYEVIFGQANQAFTEAVDILATGIERAGLSGLRRAFPYAIKRMGRVGYDRTKRKSPVLVVGEYLLNFHPGANHDIEEYLEDHGLEVIEPSMAAVYQKGYFYQLAQIRERGVKRPAAKELILRLSNAMFELAHHVTDVIASRNALYEKPQRMLELAKASDFIIDHTFDSGEGFLIPAEILHYAAQGVRSFVVMQPFGCLPNHVCGRGITKRIKEVYPDAMILPLDYDPDISMANIENRLQMLIMNQQLRSQAQFANGDPQHTHQRPTVAQKVSTCA
jgi:predicted nucleotide-binding protein (sugar kinase/HSP70/actin superfamily)